MSEIGRIAELSEDLGTIRQIKTMPFKLKEQIVDYYENEIRRAVTRENRNFTCEDDEQK